MMNGVKNLGNALGLTLKALRAKNATKNRIFVNHTQGQGSLHLTIFTTVDPNHAIFRHCQRVFLIPKMCVIRGPPYLEIYCSFEEIAIQSK